MPVRKPSTSPTIASLSDSCWSSGYGVTNRLDGSEQVIYDCLMPSGNYKCVTEQNGITSDSTAVVRLVFANTRGSKLFCLG